MRDGEVEVVDKTALTSAIKEANTNKESVKVSADGKDVESTSKWVTEADKAAYTKAIEEAQKIADDKNATKENVAKAVTDLGTATATFDKAKKAGTKVEVVDTTGLITSFSINGEKVKIAHVEGNQYKLDLTEFKTTGISIDALAGTVSEDVKVKVNDGKQEVSLNEVVAKNEFTNVMKSKLKEVDGNKDGRITDATKFNGATITLEGKTTTSVYELIVK